MTLTLSERPSHVASVRRPTCPWVSLSPPAPAHEIAMSCFTRSRAADACLWSGGSEAGYVGLGPLPELVWKRMKEVLAACQRMTQLGQDSENLGDSTILNR